MDAAEKSRYADEQRRLAAIVKASPGRFKVCDQCNSLSLREAGRCFVCGAYRFDDEVERVLTIAVLVEQTPFPFTEGTAPRLEG